ncbi:Kinase [Hexamita inflata]|uniref:non-specific serine/threonine protein kinase n=1 Tax=Hexamita inflata TaxID=28002 RepID=A0AA86PWK4_9EUKA|nr:CAMK CAMKL [Hexamita inflata]
MNPEEIAPIPQPEKPTGKRVQNYILGKQLGRGTFGDVRVATQITTQQKVAMKILDKSKIKCEDDFKRVVREIQVLKMLNNPFVVKLLEVIDTPNHIYLVTEYIDNGELLKYIAERKKLTEEDACRLFRQLVSGLFYCHTRKVCHRDLKLKNILLDSDNNIKIIDFGLSNVLAKDYQLKTACGSPSYASPEMLCQKKYDGPMVDVWSCGVILFAMICGYLPFDDPDLQQLYKKVLNGRVEVPEYVSPQATDLLNKILIQEPKYRISLSEIMKHPWYINACKLEIPKIKECDVAQNTIDFKIVYTMVQTLKGWDAQTIIKAIQQNKHNQMTATYFLLCEKRSQSENKKEWIYEEQANVARALGINLSPDGSIQIIIDKVGAQISPRSQLGINETASFIQENTGQSEDKNDHKKTSFEYENKVIPEQ